jgi:NADH-quinone oxidoreductase subunit I
MYGQGLIKGLGITLKHAFEKDLTVQYPEEMPVLHDRYRGCLAFDEPKCIACGLCTKACPNKVLHLETDKDASGKKRWSSYTIDLQYCLFCNLCVEVCPTNTLYFTHNFELSTYKRDDIKIVYHRPPELDKQEQTQSIDDNNANASNEQEADKRLKKVEAMKNALGKNPGKALNKILDGEEIAIMADLMAADEKKLVKIAELMVEDIDKARKIAQAFVNKEKKSRSVEGGNQV